MNKILQKRIEEAAHQYIQSDVVAPENMKLAFGDFINGAKFALQNQWISVDESLPQEQTPVFVAIFKDKIKLYSEAVYRDGSFVVHGVDKIQITHWAEIPKINK